MAKPQETLNHLKPVFDSFIDKFHIFHLYLHQGNGCPTYMHLSYEVASGSEITPCYKIYKPLVVFRFSGNVMKSIRRLCICNAKIITFFYGRTEISK